MGYLRGLGEFSDSDVAEVNGEAALRSKLLVENSLDHSLDYGPEAIAQRCHVLLILRIFRKHHELSAIYDRAATTLTRSVRCSNRPPEIVAVNVASQLFPRSVAVTKT